jgi:hypothetical protein
MRHSGGDKFNAGASHLGEERFPGLVDERDLFQVHDCARQGRSVARVSPTRTQLVNPGACEASVQAPTLTVDCIRIADSKHMATPLCERGKRTLPAEVRTLILQCLSKIRGPRGCRVIGTGPGFR